MSKAKPRGRPRSAALRRKILRAAANLLNERGISGVTMEAIAARAGVGKPTIYREWPNAPSVALAAFLETVDQSDPTPGDGTKADAAPFEKTSPQKRVASPFQTTGGRRSSKGRTLDQRAQPSGPLVALRLHLRATAHAFTTRVGRNTAAMIAASQHDSELAKVFRTQFILKRREEGRSLINLAVAAGQLREPTDIEAVLDLIYAPLYFRLLIGHGPLDEAYTDAILEVALDGLRRRPRKS
jgi:AcrR family transcriptional regulator